MIVASARAGTSGCFRERGRAVYSSMSFWTPGCLPWSMGRLRKFANGASGLVSGSDICMNLELDDRKI